MIVDKDMELSDDQAVTAPAPSTNIVDLTVAKDIGPGEPVQMEVRVKEDFDLLTSMNIELQVDNDVAFGSPRTVITVNRTLAQLVAGESIPGFQIVPDGVDERYMRFLYTHVGTEPAAGKIYAAVVTERQTNKANL